MADIRKTINLLETAMRYNSIGLGRIVVHHDTISDALELLKERVKTPVFFKKNEDGYFDPECGHCGQYLDKTYSVCPKCQKELNWNV